MSRFVAAGEANDSSPKDDEWARAEQRIKDSKQQRVDTGHKEEGKSLYEVCQATATHLKIWTNKSDHTTSLPSSRFCKPTKVLHEPHNTHTAPTSANMLDMMPD